VTIHTLLSRFSSWVMFKLKFKRSHTSHLWEIQVWSQESYVNGDEQYRKTHKCNALRFWVGDDIRSLIWVDSCLETHWTQISPVITDSPMYVYLKKSLTIGVVYGKCYTSWRLVGNTWMSRRKLQCVERSHLRERLWGIQVWSQP